MDKTLKPGGGLVIFSSIVHSCTPLDRLTRSIWRPPEARWAARKTPSGPASIPVNTGPLAPKPTVAVRPKPAVEAPKKEAMVKVFHIIGVRSDMADEYRDKLTKILY